MPPWRRRIKYQFGRDCHWQVGAPDCISLQLFVAWRRSSRPMGVTMSLRRREANRLADGSAEEQTLPKAKINGVELRYEDSRTPGPPLVLVHGSWGSHHNWDRVTPALSESFRVV